MSKKPYILPDEEALKTEAELKKFNYVNSLVRQLITHVTGIMMDDDKFKTLEKNAIGHIRSYQEFPQINKIIIEKLRDRFCRECKRLKFKNAGAYLHYYMEKVLNAGCGTPYLAADQRVDMLYILYRNSKRPRENLLKKGDYVPIVVPTESILTLPYSSKVVSIVKQSSSTSFTSLESLLPLQSSKASLMELLATKLDDFSESFDSEREIEKSLYRSVQHNWWITSRMSSDFERDDPLNTAIIVGDFKIKTTLNFPQQMYLTEYQIIREILFAFFVKFDGGFITFNADGRAQIHEHVTLPTVTNQTLTSVLEPLLESITQFHEMWSCFEVPEGKSLTTHVYCRAIQDILTPVKNSLIQFEQLVFQNRNDKLHSILNTLHYLQPIVKLINRIYRFHADIVQHFDPNCNYKEACYILARTYFCMRYTCNKETSCMLTSIYLQALRPYLNIIEGWLSIGDFRDPMDEFVIAATGNIAEIDLKNKINFDVREISSFGIKCPLMDLIQHQVLNIGIAVQMLIALNKISDYKVKRPRITEHLYDEFMRTMLNEISLLNGNHLPLILPPCEPKFCPETGNIIVPEEPIRLRTELEKTNRHLKFLDYSAMHLLSFGEIFVETQKLPKYDHRTLFSQLFSMAEGTVDAHEIICIILERIINKRYLMAGTLVKEVMIGEYGLIKHYHLVEDLYLFRITKLTGMFLDLFIPIFKNDYWPNPIVITTKLHQIIADDYPVIYDNFTVIMKHEWQFYGNAVEGFEALEIEYLRKWPLSVAINDNLLSNYKYLFKCMIRVRYCLWMLKQLNMKDLEKHIQYDVFLLRVKRIHGLYFGFINMITKIHSFFGNHIFPLWNKHCEMVIHESDSFSLLYKLKTDYSNEVVNKVKRVFDIKSGIKEFLILTLGLKNIWQDGMFAEEVVIAQLRSDFAVCAKIIEDGMEAIVEEDSRRSMHM